MQPLVQLKTSKQKIKLLSLVLSRQCFGFCSGLIILAATVDLIGIIGLGAMALWWYIATLPSLILEPFHKSTSRFLSALSSQEEKNAFIGRILFLSLVTYLLHFSILSVLFVNWQDLDFFFNLMQVGPFSVQNIFVFVLLRAIANAIFIFGISIFTALKKVKLTQNFYLLKRLLELSLVLLLCIDDRSQASNLSLLIYCYAAIDVGLAGCAIYALRSCKISPKLNRVSIFAFSDLIGFRKFTLPLVFTTISSSSTKRIVAVILASQAATFELGLFSTCVIIVGKLNKFPINLTNVFIGYFTQLKKMDLHRGLVNVSIAVCHVIVAQLFFFTFPQWGPLFGLVADIETTSIIWLFSSLIVVGVYKCRLEYTFG